MELQTCVDFARVAVRVHGVMVRLTEQLASEVGSEGHRHTLPGDIEHLRGAIASIEAILPNADLLRAYQQTDGEPGNPDADALLAEIERRGLDV